MDETGERMVLHVPETGATITRRQSINALCRYTTALPADAYFLSAPRCVCVCANMDIVGLFCVP